MGYLKVTSSAIRVPANVTALPRTADVGLRARRHASPPANGKAHLPRADQLALAQIAQRFAPGAGPTIAEDQRFDSRPRTPMPPMPRTPMPPMPQMMPQMQSPPPAAAPVVASPRGMRTLIATLILVALLPSALFAAMIWLGAIHLSWPAPWPKTQAATWSEASPASVAGALAAAEPRPRPVKTLTVTVPPHETPESAGIAAPQPVPQETPEGAGIASPQPVPEAAEPETTASISPAEDDAAALAAEDHAAAPEIPYDTNLIGVVSWDAKKQALLGASGVEEVFTTPEETAPPPEHLMQAPEQEDDGKTWITAPQFVNLRKGPTSSAAVIGIVAKGAKLEVLGRKRGWVRVADPDSSESGWIYTGSKARRTAKRGSEDTADGGSLWNLGGWLRGGSNSSSQ